MKSEEGRMRQKIAVEQYFCEKGNDKMGLISKAKEMFAKLYYPWRIKCVAAECGENIYVGGKTYVTHNTHLGKHCCFNGMSMSGNGVIKIGDYFHSGPGCQIITSFHNYEGDAIPYDDTFIDKNVEIGRCVWLGNNVIVLGGGENWRWSDNSGGICCL